MLSPPFEMLCDGIHSGYRNSSKVVSIEGEAVKFTVETEKGSIPVFSKSGDINAVIGAGRAAHGILFTLDTADLNLENDLSISK